MINHVKPQRAMALPTLHCSVDRNSAQRGSLRGEGGTLLGLALAADTMHAPGGGTHGVRWQPALLPWALLAPGLDTSARG